MFRVTVAALDAGVPASVGVLFLFKQGVPLNACVRHCFTRLNKTSSL